MKPIALALLLACLCAAAQAEPRDETMFKTWALDQGTREFEAFLDARRVGGVVPLYQLLRSASDWRTCNASPFEIPPPAQWPHVASVLALVVELKKQGVLGDFEAVSTYRNPSLNACARGAKSSAHTQSFAVDIVMRGKQADEQLLCQFWRREGHAWKMGLSRYPSGRIHLDTSGYRTWGADFTQQTSFCRLAP